MSFKCSKNSIPKPRQSSSVTRNLSILKKHKKRGPKKTIQVKSKNSPKANFNKHHRRVVSDGAQLVQLQGQVYEKAPKIFNNQIFRDVYDELGNHDRVLDTVESIEVYEEVSKGNFVTFNNKSDVSTEKFIYPDASYKSFEATKSNFKEELMSKLEKLAKGQDENSFIRILTLQRNQYKRYSGFSFK